MSRLPSLVKLAYPIRWLNLALMLSIVCLVLQLSGPALLRWWKSPGPGLLGTVWLADGLDTPCLAQAYLAYLPKNYHHQESWPLVVFLHGSGGRGNDPQQLRDVGQTLASQAELYFPSVVLVPQCHEQSYWQAEDIIRLIEVVEREYRINPRRIYLIGYSMGVFGAWETAAGKPDMFAAMVPIAGGGNAEDAPRLAKTPIWAFHGDKDTAVKAQHSRDMVEAIRLAGGNPKLTIFSDAGHGIRDKVLQRNDLWHWLAEQARKEVPVPEASLPPRGGVGMGGKESSR